MFINSKSIWSALRLALLFIIAPLSYIWMLVFNHHFRSGSCFSEKLIFTNNCFYTYISGFYSIIGAVLFILGIISLFVDNEKMEKILKNTTIMYLILFLLALILLAFISYNPQPFKVATVVMQS